MKINNVNQIAEYPENYDFIPKLTQDKILLYMNKAQLNAERYYLLHIQEPDKKEAYLKLYNHEMDILAGAKNVLSIMGIKVEYNWYEIGSSDFLYAWCGNREWILATKKDAEDELNYNISECYLKPKEPYAGWPKPKEDKKEVLVSPFFPMVK